MIHVHATTLHRALAATNEVAKGAARDAAVLRCLNLRATDIGLIVESTDRYQILRAHAPYSGDPAPLGTVLLSTEDAKALIPMLKKAKHAHVRISATEDTVSFTIDSGDDEIAVKYGNQQGRFGFPRLENLGSEVLEAFTSEGPVGMDPAHLGTLAKLKTLDKSGSLVFTNEAQNKPLHWAFSDWASGLVMPMRISEDDATARRDKVATLLAGKELTPGDDARQVA